MRYLVTGGLGVVGSRFVELAAQSGHMVTVVDHAEEPRNLWMSDVLYSSYGELVTILKQRVENSDFESLLRSHDFVLHAAAHTGIPHSAEDPHDDWMSNVNASRHILEAMRKMRTSVPPTVMLSSVKPYRVHDLPSHIHGKRFVLEGRFSGGIDETCLLEPDEPYAASKMAQTALVMAYGRTYDLPVTTLRCSNLYGDAPCHGPRHGWLTWFCISAALGRTLEIQGSGFQTRDMLFSDDVASAVWASFSNIRELQGNVYNIGGGIQNSLSVCEAVDLIQKIHGKPLSTSYGPGRRHEDSIFITNHQKFSTITKWAPVVNVEMGTSRVLSWAKSHAEELRVIYEEFL